MRIKYLNHLIFYIPMHMFYIVSSYYKQFIKDSGNPLFVTML